MHGSYLTQTEGVDVLHVSAQLLLRWEVLLYFRPHRKKYNQVSPYTSCKYINGQQRGFNGLLTNKRHMQHRRMEVVVFIIKKILLFVKQM